MLPGFPTGEEHSGPFLAGPGKVGVGAHAIVRGGAGQVLVGLSHRAKLAASIPRWCEKDPKRVTASQGFAEGETLAARHPSPACSKPPSTALTDA
jgi:hypothetical protein